MTIVSELANTEWVKQQIATAVGAAAPADIVEFKGGWNASTNTPALASGAGNIGDLYRVSVAGTRDIGEGSKHFAVGDTVIYNGSIWQKYTNTSPGGNINVADYGFDQAALVAAETAAYAANGSLFFADGIYTITSTFTHRVSLDGQPGAKIMCAPAFTDQYATLPAPQAGKRLVVSNLEIDGNRANKPDPTIAAYGAAPGVGSTVYRDCDIHGFANAGIQCAGAGVDVVGYYSRSHNNVRSGSGDGWLVQSGALLRTTGCDGDDNSRAGFFCLEGAADGCRIDGGARHNGMGAILRSQKGHIGSLVVDANSNFGTQWGSESLSLTPTGWQANYIESRDSGVAFTREDGTSVAMTPSGTGFQAYGIQACQIAQYVSRRDLGYGLALTHDSAAVGSCNNAFSAVQIDGVGAVDNDPGIHLSGDSNDNVFGTARVRGKTFALSMGEGVAGIPKRTVIGTMLSSKCTYAAMRLDAGQDTRVEFWESVDDYNVAPGSYPALLYFFGSSAVTHNRIGRWVQRTVDNPAPNAILTQADGANDNGIEQLEATVVALTYGTTVSPNAATGRAFQIDVTNTTGFTIANPVAPLKGTRISFDIRNRSGGAMGTVTWGSDFNLAGAFTNPAASKHRTITFLYDGVSWVEQSRAAADLAVLGFPLTPVLDPFTQANGTLTGAWTGNIWSGEPLPDVNTNQAAGNAGGWRSAYRNDITPSGDQEVYATIANASGQVDLYICITNPGATPSDYSVQWVQASGLVRIGKDVAGSSSTLEDITITINNGDALGLVKIGTSLRAWRKPAGGSWGPIGTGVTDSAFTSGRIGFEVAPTAAIRVDDFGGGSR
jgi:hypothetical protein